MPVGGRFPTIIGRRRSRKLRLPVSGTGIDLQPSNELASVMSISANRHALACTRRAAEEAAAVVRGKLARGTRSLHVIGCVAPLLGLFGTRWLFIGALRAQA